jgi:hypothetical protein
MAAGMYAAKVQVECAWIVSFCWQMGRIRPIIAMIAWKTL